MFMQSEDLHDDTSNTHKERRPRPQQLHEHIFIAIALSKAKKF